VISIPDHLSRLRAGVYQTYGLADVPEWITKKTRLKGVPFNFEGHEFQAKILSDVSTEVNVQKCSQIGLSEIQARWTLAACNIINGFSVIYTMPFAKDAWNFCRTRVDPIIESSKELKYAVNSDLNNSEIKQFGDSFIYFRGTNGETQAISIPADAIVSDEIDRSSPDVLTQYQSRLTHSPWRLKRNFSTPTQPGWGIAKKMETSRRFRNVCTCEHCNETFVPSYYDHVKIPGWDNDLRELDKPMLAKIRWQEAKLLCPKCGKVPSLAPQHRSWLQENSLEQHEAAGYYVSPFDAPLLITPAYLVQASVAYSKVTEFENQNLGLTSIDADESVTLDDLVKATVPGLTKDSGYYAMGVDMGQVCRITIGRMEGEVLVVVHRERVPLGKLEERVGVLYSEFRVVMKVFDAQPYVDLIMRMQSRDPNLFAAVFVTTKNVEAFTLKDQTGDQFEGKLQVRQAQINRNKAFDELAGQIKGRKPPKGMPRFPGVQIAASEENDIFNAEMLDMKRVQRWDKDMEAHYVWEKSEAANDHYHHSLLYLFVAARLRGLATGVFMWPAMVSSFRLKEPEERNPRQLARR
jgi:hypothetical protein